MMKTTSAKNRNDARSSADLVVEQGLVTKNRFGSGGTHVPLPDGYYTLTRIEPIELDGDASHALVRITSSNHGHPYEGMIICREHLGQLFAFGVEPPFVPEEIGTSQAAFWNQRCLMCGVNAVTDRDRFCENVDCCRLLHPQWPAVYCCNGCALEDA